MTNWQVDDTVSVTIGHEDDNIGLMWKLKTDSKE